MGRTKVNVARCDSDKNVNTLSSSSAMSSAIDASLGTRDDDECIVISQMGIFASQLLRIELLLFFAVSAGVGSRR